MLLCALVACGGAASRPEPPTPPAAFCPAIARVDVTTASRAARAALGRELAGAQAFDRTVAWLRAQDCVGHVTVDPCSPHRRHILFDVKTTPAQGYFAVVSDGAIGLLPTPTDPVNCVLFQDE
ncbi:MAG TPA: hypothetical protein VFQ53_10455 [Kofleriaceae bacterium]|nr:hypothetical protein [Kofleriaceae bacterium]